MKKALGGVTEGSFPGEKNLKKKILVW